MEKLTERLINMPAKEKKNFNKRNMAMALKVDDLLQTGKRYFFMVGALHVTEDKHSVIDNLKGLGYTATRIIVQEPL